MSLYVEAIPNHGRRPAILLRESRRERGKVKRRTLANLTRLPPHLVEAIRLVLKGGRVVSDPGEAFVIRRALARGHVRAVLGLGMQLGLHAILDRRAGRPGFRLQRRRSRCRPRLLHAERPFDRPDLAVR